MRQSFLAHGFFLSEHAVYESLAQELLKRFHSKSLQRWNIVCERKEDLLSIRTQIFSLLNKIHKQNHPDEKIDVWAGVSLYTPDSLVRNFAMTLSHNSVKQIGSEAHKIINQPFLDIVEQERLTRLLLLKLGYSGSDVAPLAKQILTLADTVLPADETFLNLLIEVQNPGDSFKTISDIPDISLRTICVAYQLIRQINSNFCRLQSFVHTYWQPQFLEHLNLSLNDDPIYKNFLIPKRFLTEPILWVAAPEYTRHKDKRSDQQSYRPGNFQAHWIDSLRDTLFDARDVMAARSTDTTPSASWWARTLINTAAPEIPERQVQVEILNTQAALEHRFHELEHSAGEHRQFLLGDIDSKVWNIGRTSGAGIHSLTPSHFSVENKDQSESRSSLDEQDSSDPLAQWENHPAHRIETLQHEFKSDWERIEKFSSVIQKALNQYELSPSLRKHGIDFKLLMHRFFDSESFVVGDLGSISKLPPALSMLPGLTDLKEIFIFGVPHSSTQPSFHLRILNAVFYYLRSKQVALDPIASEEAYRGYWLSVLSREEKVTFLLKSYKDTEKFPDYTKQLCCPPVSWKGTSIVRERATPFEVWLKDGNCIEDPHWHKALKPNPSDAKSTTVAVTAFENYVACPLKYYWLNLHKAEVANTLALRPDPLDLGQRAHSLAEAFLKSLRHIALLSDDTDNTLTNALWRTLIDGLSTHFIPSEEFLSSNPQVWHDAFIRAIETVPLTQPQTLHARALAQQLTELIFADNRSQTHGVSWSFEFNLLRNSLTREGLRRAFRKLIQTESLLIQTEHQAPSSARTDVCKAAFLELPVSYQLTSSLRLSGRIDRVDTSQDGDEIIDYKTSKVPKNDPALVLLPKQLNTTNRLSVQGAVYSLAWAFAQKERDISETRGVKAFRLFRLKTLTLDRHPILSFGFDTPLRHDSTSFHDLHSEYQSFGDTLAAGLFPAQPVLKDVCKNCALSTVCPTGQRNNGVIKA